MRESLMDSALQRQPTAFEAQLKDFYEKEKLRTEDAKEGSEVEDNSSTKDNKRYKDGDDCDDEDQGMAGRNMSVITKKGEDDINNKRAGGQWRCV